MTVTTEAAAAESAALEPASHPRPSRLGPFEIRSRLPGEAGTALVTLAVVGADGTSFAGRSGVARCFAAPADAAGRERLTGLLDRLVALDFPVISAPIYAGISGGVGYAVDAGEPTNRSAPRATPPLSPHRVGELLIPINAALETAHRAGFSHGNLTSETVAVTDDGPVIGGWTIFGRGPAADQLGLALLVVEWLSGSPFPDAPAAPELEPPLLRLERLRRHLEGTTERVVFVLANGCALDAADRYPSVTDLVAAFQEAVCRSAEELVHGGFEALSARSPEMARFLADSAERYDPEAEGLELLRMQLGAGAGRVLPVISGAAMGGAAAPVAPGASSTTPPVMTGLDPTLTAGIPPDLLALIAPPIQPIATPRNNPWLVMAVAISGLILLLAAGAAVVVFAGSR